MAQAADARHLEGGYRRPIPRLRRSDLPPAGFYHVTARGVARCDIFRDEHDRRRLLSRLGRIADDLDWECPVYCLMTTHLHLLVGTSLPRLSLGMHRLLGPYAQQFNTRYARVGHLFQERFHARVIRDETHFASAYEYIRNNPVSAGICGHPDEWPWLGSL